MTIPPLWFSALVRDMAAFEAEVAALRQIVGGDHEGLVNKIRELSESGPRFSQVLADLKFLAGAGWNREQLLGWDGDRKALRDAILEQVAFAERDT